MKYVIVREILGWVSGLPFIAEVDDVAFDGDVSAGNRPGGKAGCVCQLENEPENSTPIVSQYYSLCHPKGVLKIRGGVSVVSCQLPASQ